MKLDTFLYNLHFETGKLFPEDWQVDWKDAPLTFKLYRGLPEIPLRIETELQRISGKPGLAEIGSFLWYVYGLTQYAQLYNDTIENGKTMQSLRRFVPSGGARYPNELYIYLKLDDLPEGIYHYTNAHHRLVLIRSGNYDSYLSESLGSSCDIEACFGAVFVSTMFWKNFFKYHYFSYRLQALDAGAIIGQLLETGERVGITPHICYQFLDGPLNHLLGLNDEDESVYAVIPLSVRPSNHRCEKGNQSISTTDLCRKIPALQHSVYQRSQNILDYQMINKLNAASTLESSDSFVRLIRNKRPSVSSSLETVMVPYTKPLLNNFISVCRKRHSPENDFFHRKINQIQLSPLLKETFTFTYRNDLDHVPGGCSSRLSLYVCIYGVEGMENGAYCYDDAAHALRKIASGDFRDYLQSGLTLNNVNLFQVPLCFHIIGEKNHYIDQLGYRGYRIQQMEAGILTQKLLLAASSLGMGGHPLLGFNVKACDELYKLKDMTSLIQIPVGPYRSRAWLTGSLGGSG